MEPITPDLPRCVRHRFQPAGFHVKPIASELRNVRRLGNAPGSEHQVFGGPPAALPEQGEQSSEDGLRSLFWRGALVSLGFGDGFLSPP